MSTGGWNRVPTLPGQLTLPARLGCADGASSGQLTEIHQLDIMQRAIGELPGPENPPSAIVLRNRVLTVCVWRREPHPASGIAWRDIPIRHGSSTRHWLFASGSTAMQGTTATTRPGGCRHLLAAILALHLSLGSRAVADDTTQSLCDVTIDGHSIENLTVVRGEGTTSRGSFHRPLHVKTFVRPGKTIQLPPGQYSVQAIELAGDFRHQADNPYGVGGDAFEVAPGKPATLVVVAPLKPKITVKRHGQHLEMNYAAVDGAGRDYLYVGQSRRHATPPRFTVYRNEKVLASASFEYG